MATFLQLAAVGYRDALGRMASRADVLQQRKRATVRAAGRTLTAALQAAAPKRSGEFAKGLRFRTDERGATTRLTLYASGAHAFLLDYIRYGTRPHEIPTGGAAAQMAKGYPLRFFWAKGPTGAHIYFYWSVHHPGTKPNDFVQRVVAAQTPTLTAAMRQTVQQVVWLK